MKFATILLLTSLLVCTKVHGGVLQAKPSEVRDVISLDGLWYFTTNASRVATIDETSGYDEVNLMPVPSSYNDISTKLTVRDHAGAVWYQRSFYVPQAWKDRKIWIRFGSVCYNASVTINGQQALTHEIGHLPFAGEISELVNVGQENVILVEVNNILTDTTIPQGYLKTLISGRKYIGYPFDFFNYAGIDRPVWLYTTNEVYIDDIDIHTRLNGSTALVTYDVTVEGPVENHIHEVNILDKKGSLVASTNEASGTVTVESPQLWWPYLMDPNPGYLYTLEVIIKNSENVLVDHYKQPFGIRELNYDNTSFTINGKNIYIRGFGRHEDSDIRGKGVDLPLIVRDYNLIKWIGANCYRTSHYPYADEIMDLADQQGIMIIDEVPAVDTKNFNDGLLKNHKKSLTELYKRDKNRPSVVMWSVSNEPVTTDNEAEAYFKQIRAHIKSLDTSRPITIANPYSYDVEYSGQFMDILGVNRYEAWYSNVGEIDGIYSRTLEYVRGWNKMHNKPVIITEYGADAEEGLSFLPSYIWSEEYQNNLIEEHFRAFDELRDEGWFIGEMIWNFADFKTDQNIIRVGGNKKGLFTRNRQPKQSAFIMRKRFWELAHKLDNATVPDDLDPYIVSFAQSTTEKVNDEL